jgi:hypothetical protein
MAAQKPGKGVLVHLGLGELAGDLHNWKFGDFALVVYQHYEFLHLLVCRLCRETDDK